MSAVLLLLLFIPPLTFAAGDEKYLCIADKATGFAYSKIAKEWRIANFDVTSHKVIVSPSKDEKMAYQVTQVGENEPTFWCKYDFNSYGLLHWQGILGIGDFKFNKKNLRFMRAYIVGYINVIPGGTAKESGDTPMIEIGKCSPI